MLTSGRKVPAVSLRSNWEKSKKLPVDNTDVRVTSFSRNSRKENYELPERLDRSIASTVALLYGRLWVD